jgi:hypothetical protein
MKSGKLGLVISDGVGYRNFVLSNFINEAQKEFSSIIIYSFLPKSVYKNLDSCVKIYELNVINEHISTWFFRKLKEISHLKNHRSYYGISDNLNSNKNYRFTYKGILTRLVFFLTSILKGEKWISLYEKIQFRTFKAYNEYKNYSDLLRDTKPDILLFTHQRPPFIAPLIALSRYMNIKSTTFIFSWDNLASKGRMAGSFDYFFVWSENMKTELLTFYPKSKASQIFVVGTPQFEPYVLPRYHMDKTDLVNRFNIDSSKPIILFTCNDSTSKNDPIYLQILCDFIDTGKLNANLIVRTSPAEGPERFKVIEQKYSFVKWNHPEWNLARDTHPELWTQRIPTFNDINTLKHLLLNADIVINVLSTITLDACIFDKPIINPVFGNEENKMFNDQKFLKYKHLDDMVRTKCSIVVKNDQQFLDAISSYLTKPSLNSDGRKKLVNLEIGVNLSETSCKMVDKLKSINSNLS